MQETDSSCIALGPGGLILPENKELLEEIQGTPPLLPIDLLKLATFYRGYQTNQQLGDHLELIGLTKLAGDPKIREVVTRSSASVDSMLTASDFDHFLDDYFDRGDEPDDKFGPANPYTLLEVKRIHYSGLGLLIETPDTEDDQDKERYYVIGVSPDPSSL